MTVVRLERAGIHVTTLSAACQAIIDDKSYDFTAKCDQNGFGQITFVNRANINLVRRASTYFGEVIGNLWAARNYVIWHVACLREGVETPSGWKNLGFPIIKSEPGPTESFAD